MIIFEGKPWVDPKTEVEVIWTEEDIKRHKHQDELEHGLYWTHVWDLKEFPEVKEHDLQGRRNPYRYHVLEKGHDACVKRKRGKVIVRMNNMDFTFFWRPFGAETRESLREDWKNEKYHVIISKKCWEAFYAYEDYTALV